MPEVKEIIVVCDPSYQDIFEGVNILSMFLHQSLNWRSNPIQKCFLYPHNALSCYLFCKIIRYLFLLDSKDDIPVDLKFALPGKERQDSVYSGLEVIYLSVICIYLTWPYRNLLHVYMSPLSTVVVIRDMHHDWSYQWLDELFIWSWVTKYNTLGILLPEWPFGLKKAH